MKRSGLIAMIALTLLPLVMTGLAVLFVLPDTIPLTEEQFKTFVEQTITTEYSRRVLDGLTARNAATAPSQGAGTAGRGDTQLAAKTAHTAQEDGADGSELQV